MKENDNLEVKINKEIIVLSGLKNVEISDFGFYYFDKWKMKREKEEKNPKMSKEEIEREVKKEIKKEINNLKKINYLKYYNIDDKKSKELESTFKQIKLKINFDNRYPRILRDGKFYTILKTGLTIYDNKLFNKIYEINFEKLEKKYEIKSAILLDNNDLVFHSREEDKKIRDKLMIYRLKDGKYFLFQKIDENNTGYEKQEQSSGCLVYGTKPYEVRYLQEISGNRFFCFSNYGLKLYSLNEKSEYSIVLLELDCGSLIHEINENNFLFYSQYYSDWGYYNYINIKKISLKELTKIEKEKLKEKDYYDEDFKKIDIKNVELIKSLKLTLSSQMIFKTKENHRCESFIMLKNKYFLISIGNDILIFDIISEQLLKKYEILIEGKDNLYKYPLNIKKWNNKDDNEFFIFKEGNIFLFELTETEKNIDLKIINQSYFPDIHNIKKLTEKNNIFYNESKGIISIF